MHETWNYNVRENRNTSRNKTNGEAEGKGYACKKTDMYTASVACSVCAVSAGHVFH